ncbi:dihydrofolate reductase [Bradyrhizobium sp. U87765 SZCCT0131]|uniref:dihydrofolate reductase n=1 Tax=unclassified Bradyrhizobium TaxID=2631580 RepID=UPI001BA691DF|nr:MULTISPECIES: dihydrofolate reductase [unclassified Bradyrhizobium]MBR1220471.1 dihydrofolate reductase [Bradyrhizobium sp. U87765 SZCCT0131]MBR1263074.1 dihydrofolate reductase [Bradyrhizobium sp. U87765 SZCCT0134]MBR1307043.1 dihydrofolate reductase [Bradyrhizobium sp. U87765 SZCCT0110]MBR1323069.1 dihydrofolate reductase [Bradyrhizobium sp. U87765 SZCCT0109]MBR1345997.1 dihydrofolate reductase [Bradyrhizobium sp. U87765 SZCCT0048]
MTVLRIEGFVIVSADGMLANADRVMPQTLKFAGDQRFFDAALDAADLVVHGRDSYEDQPNSPRRTRIVLTRSVAALAPAPDNPKATLWNPAGARFEEACEAAGVRAGTAAIIGGPAVFAMFLPRYDTFWLSEAPQVRIPGGLGAFPGVPERTPHDILRAAGLAPTDRQVLDVDGPVTVTAWRRES